MNKKHIKLIFNPTAGYGRNTLSRFFQPSKTSYTHVLKYILAEFKAHDITVDTIIIRKNIDTAKVVQACCKKTYSAVVVAGGDGTVNRAINGLVHNAIPLGIIPIGSVNILALELGIPNNIQRACERIINGQLKTVDLGKVNDHYFACMTGIGFDAKVIKHTPLVLKKLCGLLSFFFVSVKLLVRYKFRPIHFKIDQEIYTRTAYFLIVNNSKYYAGNFIISNKATLSDGKLDIIIMKRRNVFRLLQFCWYLTQNKLNKCSWIDIVQAKSLNFIENQYHHIHVDAEYIGKQNAKIHVVPQAVQVFH
tara:strand:+ start:502 stop:1419 length:918 start_codon:yes stop_codon:yes gene_type:complete